MTTPIRSAVLAAATLCLLVAHPTPGWTANVGFSAQQIVWDLGNHGPEDIDAADMDGDGDTDLIVALAGVDSIALFENESGDGGTWSRRCK